MPEPVRRNGKWGQLWRSSKNRPYPTMQEWAQAMATVSHPHNYECTRNTTPLPGGQLLASIFPPFAPVYVPSTFQALHLENPALAVRKKNAGFLTWRPRPLCQRIPKLTFSPRFFPSIFLCRQFSPGFWVFNVRNCLDFSWIFFTPLILKFSKYRYYMLSFYWAIYNNWKEKMFTFKVCNLMTSYTS